MRTWSREKKVGRRSGDRPVRITGHVSSIAAGVLLGAAALGYSLQVGACNKSGGLTGSTETPTVTQAAVPPVATPAPVTVAPVDGATTSTVNFFDNAAFEAFNNSTDPKNFTAKVTSFDDQVTPVVPEKSNLVAAGKSWNDGFGRGCVQLDVAGDGGLWHMYYDKNGKPFVNPHANGEKIAECRRGAPTPEPTPTAPPTCHVNNEASLGFTSSQSTKTPNCVCPVGYTTDYNRELHRWECNEIKCYVSYWRMNQGNDNARENACENRGGVWLNTYDICTTCGDGIQEDVCKFEPNPPGNPGNDLTLYDPPGLVETSCDVD